MEKYLFLLYYLKTTNFTRFLVRRKDIVRNLKLNSTSGVMIKHYSCNVYSICYLKFTETFVEQLLWTCECLLTRFRTLKTGQQILIGVSMRKHLHKVKAVKTVGLFGQKNRLTAETAMTFLSRKGWRYFCLVVSVYFILC